MDHCPGTANFELVENNNNNNIRNYTIEIVISF